MIDTTITDISPIFGLSLTGLLEYMYITGTLVGAIVGLLASWMVARAIRQSNQAQLKQQQNADSARLVVELQKKWAEIDEFTRLVSKLSKQNADFSEESNIGYVLGVFEDLAILQRDGTLNEIHVREFFGRDIVRIGANESIRKIIDDAHQKDPKNTYNNLLKLLEDSRKWGMDPMLI